MGVGKFLGSRGDSLCRTMTFSKRVQTPNDTMIKWNNMNTQLVFILSELFLGVPIT